MNHNELRSNIEQSRNRIQLFNNDLQTLQTLTVPNDPTRDAYEYAEPHIFTNDYGLEDSINQLSDNARGMSLTPRLGIIIGTGAWTSMLDRIPADGILLCDIDDRVVKRNIDSYNSLSNPQIDTPQKYKDHFENSPIVQQLIEKRVLTRERLLELEEWERESVGKWHFQSSQERYDAARTAVSEKPVMPLHIDFSDLNSVSKLGSLLQKHAIEISFMNMTNLYNYLKEELEKSLKLLPISQNDLTILFSKNTFSRNTRPAKTLDEYFVRSANAFNQRMQMRLPGIHDDS